MEVIKNFKILSEFKERRPNIIKRFLISIFICKIYYLRFELYHCLDGSKYFKLCVDDKKHLFNKYHVPSDDLIGYANFSVDFLNSIYKINIKISDLIFEDIDVILNKNKNEYNQLQNN